VREDLHKTLLDLADRRRAGKIAFDQVIIETTGLADPGPIAQTFFLEPAITAHYRPDSILTLVDARHAMDQLDSRQEARRQVGFADRLFISKCDLASEAELATLGARLRRINPRAAQSKVAFGKVALDQVFDVRGFNLTPDLDFDEAGVQCGHAGHDGGCTSHRHLDDVGSFTFRSDRPFSPGRFGDFMRAIVASYGQTLLRYKGVLNIEGMNHKVIFQGVHQLMSQEAGAPWNDAPRESKLVFIGLNLPETLLRRCLQQCLA
jgi:G3E family GTPase